MLRADPRWGANSAPGPGWVQVTFGRFGQTLRQRRAVEENTHLRVQLARARIEIVGADKANPAVEGECLRMQTRTARSAWSMEVARSPLV